MAKAAAATQQADVSVFESNFVSEFNLHILICKFYIVNFSINAHFTIQGVSR